MMKNTTNTKNVYNNTRIVPVFYFFFFTALIAAVNSLTWGTHALSELDQNSIWCPTVDRIIWALRSV